MIVTVDEAKGKVLDWLFEKARHPEMSDVRVINGGMEILLDGEYGSPGWYYYRTSILNEDLADRARKYIKQRLGDGLFVVPTDLASPKYAHVEHQKLEPSTISPLF